MHCLRHAFERVLPSLIPTISLVLSVLAGCTTLGGGRNREGEGTQGPREDRRVGLGYSTWFPPQRWEDAWSEPMMGQYYSNEEVVLEKHADWFVRAGVDFVWIDWSNNILAHERPELQPIEEATRKLFEVYAGMDKSPQISIFLGIDSDPAHLANGNLQRKADQIYQQYVVDPEFGRLMARHEGKPLLVVYAGYPSPWQDGLPPWDDDRFTVRWMTAFVDDQAALRGEKNDARHGYWSWWERSPQWHAEHHGRVESVAVSAAYPGYYGWGEEGGRGREGGDTFREQWNRARALDPAFVLINSWNEWVKPEELDPEFSNDLEPSEAWQNVYLFQLRDEITAWRAMLQRVESSAGDQPSEQPSSPTSAPAEALPPATEAVEMPVDSGAPEVSREVEEPAPSTEEALEEAEPAETE